MLFLMFQLGKDRFALEANCVVEVVPLLELKMIPSAPVGLAGIINFRGRPVSAVDLSQLTLGRPATARLSTRIVVVNYTDAGGVNQLLGLIAEHATQIISCYPADFVDAGVQISNASYLGRVLMDASGVIQLIRAQHLLPHPMPDLFQPHATEVSHAAD